MTTHFQPLRHVALICLTFAIAACASQRPAAERPADASAAAKAPAAGQAPPAQEGQTPPTRMPEGYWPPSSTEQTSEPQQPLPKLSTTDEMSLVAKRDPKATLKQRALERWLFLINKKGDVAYEYLTPGYRSTHDQAKYAREMSDRPVLWFRASFDHETCATEASCEVTMLVDFRVRMTAGMGIMTSFAYVKERWIAVDGVWYHLPSETGG